MRLIGNFLVFWTIIGLVLIKVASTEHQYEFCRAETRRERLQLYVTSVCKRYLSTEEDSELSPNALEEFNRGPVGRRSPKLAYFYIDHCCVKKNCEGMEHSAYICDSEQ